MNLSELRAQMAKNLWFRGPSGAHPRLDGLRAATERWATSLREQTGLCTTLFGMEGPNAYFRIFIALAADLPDHPSELDYDEVEARGPAEYLEIRSCAVMPVAECTWHSFRVEDDEWEHDVFDLFDERWFAGRETRRALAELVVRLGEGAGLAVLSWELTHAPADPEWPRPEFAPEAPELRHFLFPGYFD
ncbi:hypothetical protein [Nannocystis punicea]|uniref:Uncharacterized protein n=1 Tax=Nannocystis punicea TaxID=2995304 RepID=A0ABY7GZV0_9BACT|nr:hypothetical protein [Nannocystis poenicansa]WAS92521.1 hypothetical protein O0S08_40595 [Nannocystis poenicansa]